MESVLIFFRAMSLIKKDWCRLPKEVVDSDILLQDGPNFCQHTMALDKYFTDKEIQTLETHLRKKVSRFVMP